MFCETTSSQKRKETINKNVSAYKTEGFALKITSHLFIIRHKLLKHFYCCFLLLSLNLKVFHFLCWHKKCTNLISEMQVFLSRTITVPTTTVPSMHIMLFTLLIKLYVKHFQNRKLVVFLTAGGRLSRFIGGVSKKTFTLF